MKWRFEPPSDQLSSGSCSSFQAGEFANMSKVILLPLTDYWRLRLKVNIPMNRCSLEPYNVRFFPRAKCVRA